MKYTPEITASIVEQYKANPTAETITALADQLGVPERSVIAKLASINVYQKKSYVNKRGEPPVKKEEYIERLAKLLQVEIFRLESLEKVNKSVLILLETALSPEK